MPRDDFALRQLLERLADLPGIRSKAMFGGWGVWLDDRFFAVIAGERVYFRTSPETRPKYVECGMDVFSPWPSLTLHAYYEVPADVMDDPAELRAWAEEAAATSAP